MASYFFTDNHGSWAEASKEHRMLFVLHYAYPVVIFTYYIITSAVAFCTLQNKSTEGRPVRTRLIRWLLLGAVVTYLVQLLVLVSECLIAKAFRFSQDTVIGLLSCVLVYGVEYVGLAGSENPVWHPYIGSVWISLMAEPLAITLTVLTRPPGPLTSFQLEHSLAIATRYLALLAIVSVYYIFPCMSRPERGSAAEQQALLPKEDGGPPQNQPTEGVANSYGSASEDSTDRSQAGDNVESPYERRKREAQIQMEKRLKEKGNWFTYAKGFLIFVPYIWPVGNKGLQLRAVLVGVCLLVDNLLGLLIPRQLGIVVDSLDKANGRSSWVQVIIFAFLKLLGSEAGISMLRKRLWLPLDYYSTQTLTVAAYSHVLNLSSDFHDSKSSSDIMQAIQAGSSVSNMLETVCFRTIPMLIDFTVAFVYLSITFGPYEGFITIATATMFIHVASYSIAALKEPRRLEISTWFKERYVQQAGIQGWTTVASFNQIDYEERRYSDVTTDRVAKSKVVAIGYFLAYALQYLTLLCGYLAGTFLAVYQVTSGQATAGQFMMLLTYWAQLVSPLYFFANLGKNISRDFISAEQLLEIMQTKRTVVSKEGAPDFHFKGGHVQFDSVGFSYDKKKEILKDITFDVSPGTTIAFVGQTGAGKSTILKLLDRFYDATEGSIKIDDQDIRDVDLGSLRAQIGVVQQSPILFDETILNNVRYGNLSATDEEVYEACKAACIHEQILGFSDGYNTQVGERGVKLSGGELQRIAIARAILKRPAIVLLDEATSAVDTDTEHKIQDAFRTLCKGRTTFIIAHRLSTIINADRIVVIAKGQIAEQGTHEELIGAKGKYAELWSKQIFLKSKSVDQTQADHEPAESQDNQSTATTPDQEGTEQSDAEQIRTLDGSSDDTTRNGAVSATPAASRAKEASRLNPDAPTFTPRSARALASEMTIDFATECTSSDTEYRSEDQQVPTPLSHHVRFAATPMVYVPGVYPIYTNYYIPPNNTLETSGRTEVGATAGGTGGEGPAVSEEATTDITTTGSPCPGLGLRRPQYSRRIQSKSEPSNASSAIED